MSEFDDPGEPDDGVDEASAEPNATRTIKLSVKVSAAEKAEIDKQRCNLSMSEFLRDRALYPTGFDDPTFVAVGGMHASAENVRRASGKVGSAADALSNLATTLYLSDLSKLDPSDLAVSLDEITSAIDEFREAKDQLDATSEILSREAQALSCQHLGKLIEIHPAYSLKKRRNR